MDSEKSSISFVGGEGHPKRGTISIKGPSSQLNVALLLRPDDTSLPAQNYAEIFRKNNRFRRRRPLISRTKNRHSTRQ